MSNFAISTELKIDVMRVGRCREPVLIIDDFLTDANALVKTACQSDGWRDLAPGGYPGQRAPLPRPYAINLLRRLDAPIREHIFSAPLRLDKFDCSFSMVSRRPEELTAAQRLPHVDKASPNRVAILHYLCPPLFGGTAFFRQDETGLETIGPDDRTVFFAACKTNVAALRDRDAFPDQDTPGFTRIGKVDARFNRVVVYRSFVLHSGIIDAPQALTTNPATGRLTANFFVDYAEDQNPR